MLLLLIVLRTKVRARNSHFYRMETSCWVHANWVGQKTPRLAHIHVIPRLPRNMLN